jgi:hypothetical protein
MNMLTIIATNRKHRLFFLIIISSFFYSPLFSAAITCTFDNAGRFGDCIIVYCKAKYCSLLYHCPFYYKPFPESSLLTMHTQEKWFNNIDKKITHQITISSADQIDPTKKQTLFVIDLYMAFSGKQPTDPSQKTLPIPHWMNFWTDEIYDHMQTNRAYRKTITSMLQPIEPGPTLSFPQGTISVAIHIRKGGSVDLPLSSPQLYDKNHPEQYEQTCTLSNASDKKFPLRFPPEQFYVDQLNALAQLLSDQHLTVLLFTDDNDPSALLERFRKQCPADNIHIMSVYQSADFIDDLVLMAQTDCLIRPCSHFSGTAQLMGNHRLIIRPENYEWIDPLLLITETTIIFHSDESTEYLSFNKTSSALLETKMNTLFPEKRN